MRRALGIAIVALFAAGDAAAQDFSLFASQSWHANSYDGVSRGMGASFAAFPYSRLGVRLAYVTHRATDGRQFICGTPSNPCGTSGPTGYYRMDIYQITLLGGVLRRASTEADVGVGYGRYGYFGNTDENDRGVHVNAALAQRLRGIFWATLDLALHDTDGGNLSIAAQPPPSEPRQAVRLGLMVRLRDYC